MATYRHQLEDHERRRVARIAPGLLTYASFDGSNGGMVLDVSERGLAIVTALAVPESTVLTLSIAADATHEEIEVTGRVAWMAESKRRLGIELIEVGGGESTWQRWTSELLRCPFVVGTDGGALAAGKLPAPVAVKALSPPIQVTVPEVGARETAESNETARQETIVTAAPVLVMGAAASTLALAGPLEKALSKTLPVIARMEGATSRTLGPSGYVAALAADLSPSSGVSAPQENHRPAAHAQVAKKGPSYNRTWLILATTVLVTGSFGLGILIGRSVILKRVRGTDANSAEAARTPAIIATTATNSGVRNAASEAAGRATNPNEASAPRPSVATPNSSAAMTTQPLAAPMAPSIAPTIRLKFPEPIESAETKADAVTPRVQPIEKNVKVTSPDAGPALEGVELRITLKDNDEPTRVQLPEEVVMTTPSMEITSRRAAVVPGAKAGQHRKLREEKLSLGPLLARVTPQPRPDNLSVSGFPGSEIVVSVHVTIEGDGHVSYVDPVSGPMTLMPSVMSAVREWQYGPSTLGHEPMQTEADLIIKFRRKANPSR